VLTTSSGPGGGAPGLPAGAAANRGGGLAGAPGAQDRRVGSAHAMAAVAASCKRVGAVSGLYDCYGRAAKLAAAASARDVAATR